MPNQANRTCLFYENWNRIKVRRENDTIVCNPVFKCVKSRHLIKIIFILQCTDIYQPYMYIVYWKFTLWFSLKVLHIHRSVTKWCNFNVMFICRYTYIHTHTPSQHTHTHEIVLLLIGKVKLLLGDSNFCT